MSSPPTKKSSPRASTSIAYSINNKKCTIHLSLLNNWSILVEIVIASSLDVFQSNYIQSNSDFQSHAMYFVLVENLQSLTTKNSSKSTYSCTVKEDEATGNFIISCSIPFSSKSFDITCFKQTNFDPSYLNMIKSYQNYIQMLENQNKSLQKKISILKYEHSNPTWTPKTTSSKTLPDSFSSSKSSMGSSSGEISQSQHSSVEDPESFERFASRTSSHIRNDVIQYRSESFPFNSSSSSTLNISIPLSGNTQFMLASSHLTPSSVRRIFLFSTKLLFYVTYDVVKPPQCVISNRLTNQLQFSFDIPKYFSRFGMCLSPCQKFFILGARESTPGIHIYSTLNGKLLFLHPSPHRIHCIITNSAGTQIFCWIDKTIICYRFSDGQIISELGRFEHAQLGYGYAMCINDQQNLLFCGNNDGHIFVYSLKSLLSGEDTTTGSLKPFISLLNSPGNSLVARSKTPIHSSGINKIFMDSSYLYSSGNDNCVKKTDFSLKTIGTFLGHTDAVTDCIVFDNYLFTCSSDSSIKIFDKSKQTCLCTLSGHSTTIFTIVLDTLSQSLYSVSMDCKMNRWVRSPVK